jgi:Flp pilus assembly protein TadG
MRRPRTLHRMNESHTQADSNSGLPNALNECGVALIEFTAIAFLFFTVMFGVIEVGRVILTYTTIATAARVGARYAIVHGANRSPSSGPSNDPSDVVTQVTNITTLGGLTTADIQTPIVTYPDGSNSTGKRVQVTVTYPYTSLVSVVPLNVTLTSTSEGIICY